MSLTTVTRGDSEKKLFKNPAISRTRVAGETEYAEKGSAGSNDIPAISYSVKFSAPLFNELPVTADLDSLKRLSTGRSNDRTDRTFSFPAIYGIFSFSSALTRSSRRGRLFMSCMSMYRITPFLSITKIALSDSPLERSTPYFEATAPWG